MPSQLVKATAGASAIPPKGLPPAPPGMMWQETNQQIPTGLMKLTSPGEYGAALRDMNAEWLLKVLQGAPGAVSAGEKALIDKVRAQYTTASGELKLPPDIMDQLRKGGGSAGETVQMEGWQPKGGYSGPSTTTTLNDPRMDKSVPYAEPTAPSIKSPNAYFKSPQVVPSTVQESSASSTAATPQSMTDWARMWQQNWAGKEGRPQWEEAMKLSYPTNAGEWTKWVKESDWYKSQNPISASPSGNNIASGSVSPAGNNIASGAVAPPNPSSAMLGTQLSTTAPNTGTIGTDINQSPFSPTASTRKRTSPNKYFNQRWFGTKQIA